MFGGVFTPCTLTILGVIMFLRFGFVVGQAGIIYALIIIAVSKLITVLTTLSLSAIATNTRVEGGGAYFLISRSLGVEFGGAIGLVFFLAQAISVAMYVIGFSEAVVGAFGLERDSAIWVSTVCNLFVFACVYIGAGWTIRLQYFILAMLLVSLGAFFAGAIPDFQWSTFQSNLGSSFDGESFFSVFAIFFPAVTGIMAGANMSGDLRDPAKAIPSGTLWAIAFTGLIYVSLALLMGGARDAATLANLDSKSLVMGDISVSPVLITVGVIAATLSSALGSMMGAPRILQAFAKDNVFSSLSMFAGGSGVNEEPRRATIVTFAISQAAIWLVADLNTISPLITMFFMITYGLLNMATFYEAITKNPSYRPRFRYSHWLTSLFGTVGCLGVMFLIDWRWAMIAISGMAGLYFYISKKQVENTLGRPAGRIAVRAHPSQSAETGTEPSPSQKTGGPSFWRSVVPRKRGRTFPFTAIGLPLDTVCYRWETSFNRTSSTAWNDWSIRSDFYMDLSRTRNWKRFRPWSPPPRSPRASKRWCKPMAWGRCAPTPCCWVGLTIWSESKARWKPSKASLRWNEAPFCYDSLPRRWKPIPT